MVPFPFVGNSPDEETPLLVRAAQARLVEVLPASWMVDLGPARSGAGDAVLSLTTDDGEAVTFVVEVHLSHRLGSRQIIAQLAHTVALSGHPGLVITDYANPALRAACREHDLGYIDQTGWVYLRSERPALFISRDGASRAPRPPRGSPAMTRLDGPGASHVIQTLFETALPVGVRELADTAQVSPGTVAKVLPTLAQAGVLTRDESGRVSDCSPTELLRRWTEDYDFTRSNRDVAWLLAPRGIDWVLAQLQDDDTVDVVGRPVATASLAARHLLPPDTISVTPLTLAALYSADPGALASHLRLRPATKTTANLVLARPRDTTTLNQKPVINGFLPIAPRARVLADLLTLGGRFVDEADQLLTTIESPRLADRDA